MDVKMLFLKKGILVKRGCMVSANQLPVIITRIRGIIPYHGDYLRYFMHSLKLLYTSVGGGRTFLFLNSLRGR